MPKAGTNPSKNYFSRWFSGSIYLRFEAINFTIMKPSFTYHRFPLSRIATFDVLSAGKKKHHIGALLEFDVSEGRKKLKEAKERARLSRLMRGYSNRSEMPLQNTAKRLHL
jgi:hypothetical protein